MDNMNPEEIVRGHMALCDDVLAVIMEENRILRSTGAPPLEDFLSRKRTLLPRLDQSLERLRAVRESGTPVSEGLRRTIESAQNKLMKIFMLDRENEQLLLKATMPVARMGAMPVIRRTTPDRVRRTYGS
ncbi:MAG TPA: hypothetical protein PKI32_04235 [Opitutales bacterium]|nr:hypothetical protein [Opitutales bacterium]